MEHEGSKDSEPDEHPGCGRGTAAEKEHQPAAELEDNSYDRCQGCHTGESPGGQSHPYVLTRGRKVHGEPCATYDK